MQTTQTPIKAAIGAAVRFFPASSGDADLTPGQSGWIVHLWSDTCANIEFDMLDGRTVIRSSVPVFQEGQAHGIASYYAELIQSQAANQAEEQPEAADEQPTQEAPRITLQDIEASIRSEYYFTAADGIIGRSFDENDTSEPTEEQYAALDMVTICVLILNNGTKIFGVNEGPVSPENFNATLGKTYARAKAIEQIWPLLGYELRSALQSEAVIKPVELQVELRTDNPAVDLRDVVAGMTLSPSAIKHPSEFTEPELESIAKGLIANSGYDEGAAIGDRSNGVGEGPAGESDDDLPDSHPV
jgi:hypothetical protein